MNNRGQGMSTNTIILLVLGLVILVVLILGFTMGWSKLAPWLSSDNVDTIVNSCNAACSTNSVYDYCTKQRELKADGVRVETSCVIFAEVPEFDMYGIADCNIDCDKACSELMIDSKSGAYSTQATSVTSCLNINQQSQCTLQRGCQWVSNSCQSFGEGLKSCSDFSSDEDSCRAVGCEWAITGCSGTQTIPQVVGAYDVSVLASDLDSGQRCYIY